MSAYLELDGTSGNYISTPDDAAMRIASDIDITIDVALDDWTPTANTHLIDRYDYPNVAWTLQVRNDGYVYFYIQQSGGSLALCKTSAALGVTDGTRHVIRAVLDVAGTGDASFYLDGVKFGSDSTPTSAITVIAPASGCPLTIGADGDGTGVVDGKIYSATVKDGIDGTIVAKFDAEDWVGI